MPTAIVSFDAWAGTLPRSQDRPNFPVPGRDGTGLPPGWALVAQMTTPYADTDAYLTRTTQGDWVVLRHEHDITRTQILRTAADLRSLWAWAENVQNRHDIAMYPYLTEQLRSVITTMFDPADPTEETERVLFALGGPLACLPAVAH